jgi:hypothetical protein
MSIFPAGVFINTILKTWQKGLMPLPVSHGLPAIKMCSGPAVIYHPASCYVPGLFSAFFMAHSMLFFMQEHCMYMLRKLLSSAIFALGYFCFCWQISYQARKFFKK